MPPTSRLQVQTLARAGAVQLLTDYGAAADIKLQVYRARPRSIAPPCAFVDRMTETLTYQTLTTRQRIPQVHIVVVHGIFDTGEAVDQRDLFVDGFLDWVADRFHAFGANTMVEGVALDDLPAWVPEWQPPTEQRTYFATEIVLEGFAST